MKRPNFEKGFTLVELIFVLAIILSLAAIFLPLAISRLSDADTARTNSDIDAIAAALTGFFSDVKSFPACDSSDCDPFTSANNDLKFLAFGSGSGDISTEYPSDTSSLFGTDSGAWVLTSQDSTDTIARNNAYNHLVVNNPNADGSEGTGTDYPTNKWDGPYIAKISVDNFGKAYFAHVGAMETNGSKIGTGKGWILSAGPNNVIETATSASSLGGDDKGFIFMTR